jgi:16S rRNA (cytidine1402-2'-O)-methyltransferase
VAAVRAGGHRVIPVPGASSVTALLSVAGVTSQEGILSNGFTFVGFLPSKSAEREAALQTLSHEQRALVLLEAPHRIGDLARALACLGERAITIGRELTKQFEEVHTLPAATLAHWLQEKPQRSKGEFALVIHPPAKTQDAPSQNQDTLRILKLLLAELPLKTAVRLAVDITGGSRNELYELALQIKNKSDNPDF